MRRGARFSRSCANRNRSWLIGRGRYLRRHRQKGRQHAGQLSELDKYRAGQTGLLRLTWDNGDRTVLVNPELGGVTLGWNLSHTAADELLRRLKALPSIRA